MASHNLEEDLEDMHIVLRGEDNVEYKDPFDEEYDVFQRNRHERDCFGPVLTIGGRGS